MSSDVGMSSPVRVLPSLNALLEEVRAPGAGRDDVDALLRGLARPMPEDNSPRERADLLLSILEDSTVSAHTGSNGRTVRAAAVKALLALGYPYALEVPPEALSDRRPGEGELPRSLFSTSQGMWGFGLVMAVGVLLLIVGLLIAADSRSSVFLAIILALVGGSTFLPAALTVWGHNSGSKGLKALGTAWLTIVGLLITVPCVIVAFTSSMFTLIPGAVGGALLAGTWLMNSES
ncbi:hypothetical protein [Hyalangium versicolor]|uniref:hypothetical protein n=1 Tax=Hyalangium versicolor TaxID=2861190 RepID=UPI001CCEA80C|nr:hypothetical protein [Hyalangium versicolor]